MSHRRFPRKRFTREQLRHRVEHLGSLHKAVGDVALVGAANVMTAEEVEILADDFVTRCEQLLKYAKKFQCDVRGMDELPPAQPTFACC